MLKKVSFVNICTVLKFSSAAHLRVIVSNCSPPICPSIHPSSNLLQGQQSEHEQPDFLLLRYFLQLFQVDSMTFQGHPSHLATTVSLGSLPGFPPGRTYLTLDHTNLALKVRRPCCHCHSQCGGCTSTCVKASPPSPSPHQPVEETHFDRLCPPSCYFGQSQSS